MDSNKQQRIYLDYASSTPVRGEVLRAMEPYWRDNFANPQAVHKPGRTAHAAIEEARKDIAAVLDSRPSEIIFTSGATESNSLALLGGVRAFTYKQADQPKPEVLVSEIAHSSVRNIGTAYPDKIITSKLPVDADGQLKISEITAQISEITALISFSYANSEIGTYQPVADVVKEVKKYRSENNSQYPLIHIDASQSSLYKAVNTEALGADLLTVNSQKIYGPKGIGLLWARSGIPLSPLFLSNSRYQVGDYQKLRPGTQPVPLIVGMREAIVWAQDNYETHATKISKLQAYFIESLKDCFPDIRINGSLKNRVPNNVSVTFPRVTHDYLATRLDAEGITVATTSACQARDSAESEVLQAISDNQQALRFSFGIETTTVQIDQVIKTLKDILER